ncbi:MAG: hypothetical protein V1754_06660 [Pseudomonadota bacterium]
MMVFRGFLVCTIFFAFGCAQPPAQKPPPKQEPAAIPASAPAAPAPEPMVKAPENITIDKLQQDPNKVVRIRGYVSAVLGMRMVPRQTIITMRDDTGAVTAVIEDEDSLKEGTEVELTGRYQEIPSPMYNGPDEAPKEPVFVVESVFRVP